MSRSVLALALLAGVLASAQPRTYFPPIDVRTTPPVPNGAVSSTLWLSDPGTDAGISLLFATVQTTSAPFFLWTGQAASLTNFPAGVDAMATAPGVLVQGVRRTLLALSTGGAVQIGTLEGGAFVSRGPAPAVSGHGPLALSATADGGAMLFVSDSTATQLSRWDLGLSSPVAAAAAGPSGTPITEPARSLALDAPRDILLVGGNTNGNLYLLRTSLDGGATLLDAALGPTGRLAPPVTGIALYQGANILYALVTSTQGLIIYDLLQADPRPSAIKVVPGDTLGQLTSPTGVAVTNLPANPRFPQGVIALGDSTNHGLALVRWEAIDAGLAIDSTTDPRGTPGDGGPADGGRDAGDGGGGSSGGPGGGPLGPGIPVDQPSSCASAAGPPTLAALLAGLGALASRRRRQRR